MDWPFLFDMSSYSAVAWDEIGDSLRSSASCSFAVGASLFSFTAYGLWLVPGALPPMDLAQVLLVFESGEG
ncbi:hypothetical protein HNR62_002065 [Oceanisphaera litoralis]|uniref:hypothetical protein n=1 Tax=Oceanisphaera litoralis TaxID=225144 RepID=UPI00195B3011|nr:hypothetical protein [Oceanisphaera litoralis]MBM7456183.1 hypothetical protein [Oceanisphaera litoralis]